MKNVIATAIVAFGIIAGVSAVNAEPFNPTTFFEEVDRSAA